MAKHESGSFSWNESEPSEPTAKDGLPTEVADSLPTMRMNHSSESAETHRDLPRPGAIDPFSLTLDDAGATRLELEQTLPPIRAPSARLVAPSLPEKPPPPTRTPPPPVVIAESAPTEPELEPPPASALRRRRQPAITLVLIMAAFVFVLSAFVLYWYAAGDEAIVATPPAQSR